MTSEPVRPGWMDGYEPEVADLTDKQLEDYVVRWRDQGEGYRSLRRQVGREHPDAFRLAHSGWWCSKRESIGLREQARRRGHATRPAREG